MSKHTYHSHLIWQGNTGLGTAHYQAYERSFLIKMDNKPDLTGSADPAFLGDATRHNPEDLFLASLSACHMLWYLHLCADAGIVVAEYHDHAEGIMETAENGSGRFTQVTLRPKVSIEDADKEALAFKLHESAHKMCFIANSCNFPVKHEPEIEIG